MGNASNGFFMPMLSDITMKMNPGGAIWCGPSRVLPDQPIEIKEMFIPGVGVRSLQSIIIDNSNVTKSILSKMTEPQ